MIIKFNGDGAGVETKDAPFSTNSFSKAHQEQRKSYPTYSLRGWFFIPGTKANISGNIRAAVRVCNPPAQMREEDCVPMIRKGSYSVGVPHIHNTNRMLTTMQLKKIYEWEKLAFTPFIHSPTHIDRSLAFAFINGQLAGKGE